jgi:phage terminase large subunit
MDERTHIVIPYIPRDVFMPFHNRQERFAVVVAHRRCGKTVATLNDMIRRAITDGKENARYAYVAPYYQQAKQVAWDYLKYFTQPIATRIMESELSVDLINGAKIRLYGADNPDSLRGIYLDGVVLDEAADMRESVWGEIVRPALADRKGWAVWIGTPKGHDAFFETLERARGIESNWYWCVLKASETNILPKDELEAAAKEMTPEQYAQEFECAFEAAIIGAIYGKEVAQARDSGRITQIGYDPMIRVDTYWDLGVGDSTCIWFSQQHNGQVRVIDYYEMNGAGLDHYAAILDKRGYLYGRHVAPHDIEVRELGSGKSRLEIAHGLGINFDVAPKLPLEDGINAAKMLFPRCWFDQDKCKQGLEALAHYRRDYNDKLRSFKPTPVHDWASHGADSFRYMAVAIRDNRSSDEGKYKTTREDFRRVAGNWRLA